MWILSFAEKLTIHCCQRKMKCQFWINLRREEQIFYLQCWIKDIDRYANKWNY